MTTSHLSRMTVIFFAASKIPAVPGRAMDEAPAIYDLGRTLPHSEVSALAPFKVKRTYSNTSLFPCKVAKL